MKPPSDHQPRPMVASLFMAAPIVFIGAIAIAVVILWALTRFGANEATGQRVAIALEAGCMAEAEPLLTARADQIGMNPSFEADTLMVTLPKLDDAIDLIPALLVRPGRFTLDNAATGLSFDNLGIEQVSIDLDNAGMPNTLIKLTAAVGAVLAEVDQAAVFVPTLDGLVFDGLTVGRLVEDGELILVVDHGKTADRMQLAADQAIILAHGPLPCSVRVKGVAAIASRG